MNWISVTPAVLTSAALLMLPGLAVGAFSGLRRLWLWALAPLVSITLLCLGSIVLPWLGIPWSPISALLFAALIGAAVVVLFRFVLRARFDLQPAESHRSWPAIAAWAFSATVLVFVTISGIGEPGNFSQSFDNVFHLNAIAFIGDTGNASPFDVSQLTSPDGGQRFYPNGWHALTQLSQQLSGVSVPVAINAFNIAVVATVWPLGMLLLTRQLAGSSRVATLATGVLSAVFPAFPLHMLYYGVLYPYFFGIALAPAVLAAVLNLLGISREPRITTITPLIVLLTGLTFAISIAHPGAMLAVLVATVPVATVAVLTGWKTLTRRGRFRRIGGYAVFVAIGLGLMLGLRQGDWWGAQLSHGEAAKQTFSLALLGYGLPLLTALLMLLGIIAALRQRDRIGTATAGIWFVAAVLFFVASSSSNSLLRLPTQVWYGDYPRLLTLYVIAVIPVAVLGVLWIVKLATRYSPRAWVPEVVALAILIPVTLLTAGYDGMTTNMRASYTANSESALLTTDEIALLERIPEEVGKNEMIAGNPWTGTSLAFALADRQVVFPHMLMNDVGADRKTVMKRLDDAATDASVCQASKRLGVRYVLDFGREEVHGKKHIYRGLESLDRTDTFKLVDSEGSAKLYRLTACD